MLDPKLLRSELDAVTKRLASRGFQLDSERLKSLEQRRKTLQVETEKLQASRNLYSRAIGQAKSSGQDAKASYQEASILNDQLRAKLVELRNLRNEIQDFYLTIPNLPSHDVPLGENEEGNQEVSRWGKPAEFSFSIKDHVELGEQTKGLDFHSATKITGSRFVVIRNQLARLHRALGQFMIDLHTEKHGYIETHVPYLVNRPTLYGTGQLPRFGADLFHTMPIETADSSNYTLIPTAEVPLTNLVRGEIIEEKNLPIKLTAHTPCFRSEAGSYGRDTRGLIRMHQFDKVELVQIVNPEYSEIALEELVSHAEVVLQLLKLPYRKVLLCTGDMGFGATKTYDLEVWFPTQSSYREISSCSNMSDFQARRMKARYRSSKNHGLVHTLNGSGLAVGRTLAAIMENYQQEDGTIEVPDILHKYMNGLQYIG